MLPQRGAADPLHPGQETGHSRGEGHRPDEDRVGGARRQGCARGLHRRRPQRGAAAGVPRIGRGRLVQRKRRGRLRLGPVLRARVHAPDADPGGVRVPRRVPAALHRG